MPLEKYLSNIDKTTNALNNCSLIPKFHPEYKPSGANSQNQLKNKLFYAKIINSNSKLCIEISDKHLVTIYNTKNINDNKLACSLKWINTRNIFSLHILKNLLHHQKKYWLTGKNTYLKPLTHKQFLTLYPVQYLDNSRLSRLISSLPVINLQNELIDIYSLFISKKKHHSYLIKEIIDNSHEYSVLKDKNIRNILAKKGIRLSIRTICNCRKLLNIPNYKERTFNYEKNINFSEYILITKKIIKKIPDESGIYELSISEKINYKNYKNKVVYIGSSKNLRKRISYYAGNKVSNKCLIKFISKYDIYVKFYPTANYKYIEKELLKNFKIVYGELPKANSIGG